MSLRHTHCTSSPISTQGTEPLCRCQHYFSHAPPPRPQSQHFLQFCCVFPVQLVLPRPPNQHLQVRRTRRHIGTGPPALAPRAQGVSPKTLSVPSHRIPIVAAASQKRALAGLAPVPLVRQNPAPVDPVRKRHSLAAEDAGKVLLGEPVQDAVHRSAPHQSVRRHPVVAVVGPRRRGLHRGPGGLQQAVARHVEPQRVIRQDRRR
mmetsp:Transcript_25668/g.52561  ORF Transcript_25668/g.52561 Transcript_25668/m.52561 type:complete len:205 (-) Transcript_25668:237-851(-)